MSSSVVTIQPRGWLATQWRRDRVKTALLVVLAAGLVARVIGAGSHGLGANELVRYYLATLGTFTTDYAPLFTFLVRVWSNAGLAENEWLLRLLPILLGVAGLIPLFVLSRDLRCPFSGVAAVAIAAFAPMLVAASQDLSPTALLFALWLWPPYFLHRAWRTGHLEHWILYAVTACASIFAGPAALVGLFCLNVWFLIVARGWKPFIGWLFANGFVAGVCGMHVRWCYMHTPWSAFQPGEGGGIEMLGLMSRHLISGAGLDATLLLSWSALVALVIIAGIVSRFRSEWQAGLLLFSIGVLPIALFTGFASRGVPITVTSISPLLLALCASAGIGAASTPRIPRGTAGIITFVVMLTLCVTMVRGDLFTPSIGLDSRTPWREVAAGLSSRINDGDTVLAADPGTLVCLRHHAGDDFPIALASVDPTLHPASTGEALSRCALALGYDLNAEIEPALRSSNTVLFASPSASDSNTAQRLSRAYRWCQAHLFQTGTLDYPGLDVIQFERKIAGRWTRIYARLADDDRYTRVTYRTDADIRVNLRKPSFDVPSRSGRVSLSLGQPDRDATRIRMVEGSPGRRQGIVLKNETSSTIKTTLSFAATAQLVDLSGFTEEKPATTAWRFGTDDSGLLPSAFSPIEPMVSHVARTGEPSGLLTGSTDLAAGQYHLMFYHRVTMASAPEPRAQLRLVVGGQDMYTNPASTTESQCGWRWLPAGWLDLKGDDGRLTMSLLSVLPSREAAADAEVGYVGFVRSQRGQTAADQLARLFQTQELEVAPGQTAHYLCELDEATSRLDVWATVEDGELRRYHVFRRWDAAGAID